MLFLLAAGYGRSDCRRRKGPQDEALQPEPVALSFMALFVTPDNHLRDLRAISRGPRRPARARPADVQSSLSAALIFSYKNAQPVAIEEVQRRAGSCRKCPVKMKRAEAGVACQFQSEQVAPRDVAATCTSLG